MFKEKRRPIQRQRVLQPQPAALQPGIPVLPVQRARPQLGFWPAEFTKATAIQRQSAAPALQAASLHTKEVSRLGTQAAAVRRQIAELPALPAGATEAALQRQAAPTQQTSPPLKPQSPADWVTVMRFQAEQAQGRALQTRESMHFTALQRQVAQTLTQNYLRDRQPAIQRQQEYAQHVVTLQRHPLSGVVGQAFMRGIPAVERPTLQRAVDEIVQREALQRQQDEQALQYHSLQRQLAELNAESTQPVFERIQARRGSGNPLPEAVQRHLEQGLNHDLSSVRIHDDAEADKMAKGVNAIAFTTGTDIFFQSGKFNPNTQTGMELLAHEVTHTVQQSKGQVGKGVDPDSGLEAEARTMGQKLAATKPAGGKIPARRLQQRSSRASLQAVQRAPASNPPSWNTTASPAMLEQMIQKDMPGFLRIMLGRTLLDQTDYSSKNRRNPQATPSLGRIFLNSLDHVPISKESRQKVVDAAIHKPGLPDWVRLEVAKTAVALKRTNVSKGQATIKALEAKIAKAASMDHIGDFGKAIGSRLVDTVVGIYKMAKFVAWDNSPIRMLVNFPGYKKMWMDIGATGAMIAKNPGLIWDAMTKDAKDAWSKGEYGKSLGYITFDVASVVTGLPGAARGAATLPGKAKVVLAIAKDAKGNMVAKVTEVGDQIAAGMQMTANDIAGRPNLATANVGGPARPGTRAPSNAQGMAAQGTGPINPMTGVPAAAKAGQEAPATKPPISDLEKALANKNLTDEQLEKLLQHTKNWKEVERFIGEKADGKLKIPGYYWRPKENPTELVRNNAQSGDYAPLTLVDGIIVLKAGGSNRISVYSRYRRNYINEMVGRGSTRAAVERFLGQLAADGKPMYQLHHMIPDNVAQAHELVKAALERVSGYTIDRGTNMYAMPRQVVPGNPYAHLGSHPLYDAWVRSQLDEALLKLTKGDSIPLDKVSPKAIDAALKKVEVEIGTAIKTKNLPPEIIKELEGGGFKISQNNSGEARGEFA